MHPTMHSPAFGVSAQSQEGLDDMLSALLLTLTAEPRRSKPCFSRINKIFLELCAAQHIHRPIFFLFPSFACIPGVRVWQAVVQNYYYFFSFPLAAPNVCLTCRARALYKDALIFFLCHASLSGRAVKLLYMKNTLERSQLGVFCFLKL